jgi:acetyltransferase-like isoleucine patch superfamily enzyme
MNPASIPYYFLKVRSVLVDKFKELHYRSTCQLHTSSKVMAGGRIFNVRKSRAAIRVGAETIIRGELLTFAHGGAISIGDWCYVGENSRVWSADSVSIGNRVLISHNVNIHDTNGHPNDAELRHADFRNIATVGHPKDNPGVTSSPIVIEDDVWIGFNTTILKGVTIGKGAIVGASSVVTRSIPPGVIVVGNPAKIVEKLDEHSQNL